MTVVAMQSDQTPAPISARDIAIADLDIVSFCAVQPDLLELAYHLADHGHIHVGEVIQLSHFTVRDFAGGDLEMVSRLERRLAQHGLHLDLMLLGWTPPQPLECVFE